MTSRTTIAAAVATGTAAFCLSMGAGAATATYEITGTMGKNEHSCSAPINSIRDVDCSFGRTQLSLNDLGDDEGYVWVGPTRNGGYYEFGGQGDSLTYNPNDADPSTPEIFEPDNIKVQPVVVGTVLIDDQGTPSDGTDDTVRLTFSIQGPTPTAGIVRNVAVGETTRAIERWQSLDQSMTAPYPVDQAIANGVGGFDYVIGSRGTPTRPCRALNPGIDTSDCFPSNNFDRRSNNPTPFEPPFWAPVPATGSVGIERSPQIGNRPGSGPNVGLQMVGVFRDRVPGTNTAAYSCVANGATDCASGQLVWGSSAQNLAAPPSFQPNRGPGFDNMVGVISTSATGIDAADFYWTQEYAITAFAPGITSNQSGTIEFTGIRSTTDPTAVDDAFPVVAGTANSTLNVLANDRNFPAPPATTVTITVPPNAGGTATVNANGTINYTPVAASGVETFTYRATTTVEGNALSDEALVTVTIQPDLLPGGGPVALAVNTQGRSGAAAAANVTLTQLGNLPSTVTLTSTGTPAKGVCSVAGAVVTYTPTAAFVNGGDTDSCNYSITDLDLDNATGVINVTITDVQPVVGDGSERPVDAGDSTTSDAGFTAGNGSVAQHTLAVTSQATSGSCTPTVVGANIRVSYTANDDASGADSCVVTLTDADGDSDTGTFTFNVQGGGITLPGSSAMDPWSLLLLGGLPLLARRRRR